MHPAFKQINHRPWPLPSRPWILTQSWQNLVFLHWEADPNELRKYIPAQLELDLFEDKAWIGIVPFDIKGTALRGFPTLGPLSNFPENNVRTYVKMRGKAGVWFFSLDIPNPAIVMAARVWFHLPYFRAFMKTKIEGDCIYYYTKRHEKEFEAIYSPVSSQPFVPNAFGVWATERYCLYSQSSFGNLFRAEIQHPPWLLQAAKIQIIKNTLLDFKLGSLHPSILFSRHQDVVIWSLDKLL